MVRRKKRSVKIESRGKGLYSVVKYRKDGVGTSVGLVDTKKEAKALKKKNLWTKKK